MAPGAAVDKVEVVGLLLALVVVAYNQGLAEDLPGVGELVAGEGTTQDTGDLEPLLGGGDTDIGARKSTGAARREVLASTTLALDRNYIVAVVLHLPDLEPGPSVQGEGTDPACASIRLSRGKAVSPWGLVVAIVESVLAAWEIDLRQDGLDKGEQSDKGKDDQTHCWTKRCEMLVCCGVLWCVGGVMLCCVVAEKRKMDSYECPAGILLIHPFLPLKMKDTGMKKARATLPTSFELFPYGVNGSSCYGLKVD